MRGHAGASHKGLESGPLASRAASVSLRTSGLMKGQWWEENIKKPQVCCIQGPLEPAPCPIPLHLTPLLGALTSSDLWEIAGASGVAVKRF